MHRLNRFRSRLRPMAAAMRIPAALTRLRPARPFAFPALPLAALLLAGCLFSTDDRRAGGAQDFPNTVALGKAASTHIDDHTGWDQFSALPSNLPGFAEAESLVVAPETASVRIGAAKAGKAAAREALLDTVIWELDDTAGLGVARRIRRIETAVKSKADTLTWLYDARAKDSIPGNEILLESKGAETVTATGRRTAYRYENADSSGGFDRAVFIQRLPAILPAGFKHRLFVVRAAPGGGFGLGEGALPVYYAFARTRTVADAESDTLESFDIADADGDGTLWGEGDSGTVDFRQKIPTPAQRPSVELATLRMRAVLFKADFRAYPVSYRETRLDKNGKQESFSVRGTRGGVDSVFLPGDTAWVSVRTDFPEGARLIRRVARYKVRLGGEPGRYSGNALLRYSLEASWRSGDSLGSTKFVFTPSAAVPAGELSIDGDWDLEAAFANGHIAHAVGAFRDKIITAEVRDTDKDGNVRRFRAKWDSRGEPLGQEPVK